MKYKNLIMSCGSILVFMALGVATTKDDIMPFIILLVISYPFAAWLGLAAAAKDDSDENE